MSFSPTARVIGLNNRAVTMLRHGQQKRALDTFRLALETFQEARQEQLLHEAAAATPPPSPAAGNGTSSCSGGGDGVAGGTADNCTTTTSHHHQLLNVDGEFSSQVRSVIIKMQFPHHRGGGGGGGDGGGCGGSSSSYDEQQLEEDDEDAQLHVFNRALVLSPHGSDGDAKRHPDAVLAAVLYNLALVSHLRGVQTRSLARYQTALRLYQMAYEIIQAHDDDDDDRDATAATKNHNGDDGDQSSSSSCCCCQIFEDILVLALVNNLGHVQSHLGQWEEARRQTDFLRAVVGMSSAATTSTSTPDGDDDATMVVEEYYFPQVDEQDYFFFYLNALEERVSAPAA